LGQLPEAGIQLFRSHLRPEFSWRRYPGNYDFDSLSFSHIVKLFQTYRGYDVDRSLAAQIDDSSVGFSQQIQAGFAWSSTGHAIGLQHTPFRQHRKLYKFFIQKPSPQ
jgi:hypothetical protein